MLVALRHIKKIERVHLISNATELMAEDCYDIAIRFGKKDTKKRFDTV